jgi:hypothetical protein
MLCSITDPTFLWPFLVGSSLGSHPEIGVGSQFDVVMVGRVLGYFQTDSYDLRM